MKSYLYFLFGIVVFVVVWVIYAPLLISAKDDTEVASGYIFLALSIPAFVWIGKKIYANQKENIHKLKELIK